MEKKVRIVVDPDAEESVVIYCKSVSDDVIALEKLIVDSFSDLSEMCFERGGTEYFIPISDILFFESGEEKVVVHTSDAMYYTSLKLFEIAELLPSRFMRVSKSTVVNLMAISSVCRDVTGSCEVRFYRGNKKIYVSRMYYKLFRQNLDELRSYRREK